MKKILTRISKIRPESTIVYLQALLMPNGELLHQGKVITTFNESSGYIYVIKQ